MAAKENFRDRVSRHSLAWVMSDKTRVLILGGGFGGFYAALEFEKRNDPRFEVTVVPARHRGIATRFRIQAKKRSHRCLRNQLEPMRHEHNY